MTPSPRAPAPRDLLSLLDAIDGLRLLVVGDVMLDTYLYGRTDRVSREAPVPVIVYTGEAHLLGGAGNVARNGADLGAQVSLVSLVGDDVVGDQITQALQVAKVSAQALLVEPGRHSLNKLRVMAGAEGTARQQVLRFDRGHLQAPSSTARRQLVEVLAKIGGTVDAVVVSDYGGELLDAEAMAVLAALAQDKPVVVDSRYRLQSYQGPFYLKPNADELRAASLAMGDSQQSFAQALAFLRDKTGARAVLSTRGRQGMVLLDQHDVVATQEIFGPAEVTDVTGAGDTVAASFALALAAKASERSAMQFASICAGLVVQKPGAATVTPGELQQAITHENLSSGIKRNELKAGE